jgi:transcriptional regulator with XRE-family HTH domain
MRMSIPRNTRGSRFAAFREAMGWTQLEMAIRMGRTRAGTVSNWEHGKAKLDDRTLRAAAAFAENSDRVYRWLAEGGERPRIHLRSSMIREGAEAGYLAGELGNLDSLPPEQVLMAATSEVNDFMQRGEPLVSDRVLAWLRAVYRAGRRSVLEERGMQGPDEAGAGGAPAKVPAPTPPAPSREAIHAAGKAATGAGVGTQKSGSRRRVVPPKGGE